MIWVSVLCDTVEELLESMVAEDRVEVRLDNIRPNRKQLEKIFSGQSATMVTMRCGDLTDGEIAGYLIGAMECGADYVDVSVDMEETWRDRVVENAKQLNCKVVVSHHDFESTPPMDRLNEIVAACFEAGADVVKVACTVNSESDCIKMLDLLGDGRPIVPIGMGTMGRVTRVAGPLLGSPFTFAAPERGVPTAKGQLTKRRLAALIEEMGRG